MQKSSKHAEDRTKMIAALETRRKALSVSKRALAMEAGLNEAYYQHLVAGAFCFPTDPKLRALNDALKRLEKLKAVKTALLAEQEVAQ